MGRQDVRQINMHRRRGLWVRGVAQQVLPQQIISDRLEKDGMIEIKAPVQVDCSFYPPVKKCILSTYVSMYVCMYVRTYVRR